MIKRQRFRANSQMILYKSFCTELYAGQIFGTQMKVKESLEIGKDNVPHGLKRRGAEQNRTLRAVGNTAFLT